LSSWKAEYPFESHYLPISGTRLHYVDEGPRDSEQAIVCVHGNPTWSFYYRSIISQFKSQYRSLAIDHIGCGLSDKPRDYDYCLAKHTANLVDWLDRLDLKNVVMVVHDWGGAIGLGAAVQRPDRIAKLMILNTAAFPPPYIPLRIAACRIPVLGSAAIRYLNAFAGTATWMAIDRLPRLSTAAREGLLYPYRTPSDRVAIDRFVQDIPMARKHRTRSVLERLKEQLPTLASKPTRIVWGVKDWCFRMECLERLKVALPQASVRELSDVGHYVMEEASQEVIEEMEKLLASFK
jgi:cis-3-alkyl-4-acyloxetan-2-one decarboxylase